MATQDLKGWGSAPGGTHWACPECEAWSPIGAWAVALLSDGIYVDEDARRCPSCEALVPLSDGSAAIAATIEQLELTGGLSPRLPQTWAHDVPVLGAVSSGAPAQLWRG